ncbi:MAG: 30S ribosomal protein S12 methylthiotransferase RimO [Acidobacteriota bacterium]
MSGAKTGSGPRRRVALVSLGCPKNQVDSELMLGRLVREGHEYVADPEQADTLIVNTCAFIDRAREESVEALLDAASWKQGRAGREVVAAGCLVQRCGDELARELPELDALVGLDDVTRVTARLPALGGAQAAQPAPRRSWGRPAAGLFSAADPRLRLTPPWSAWVKIAEGCDQSCAFCAIPGFRGRVRSRPVDDLVAELRALAAEGVVEANLVAQDSTGYGRDLGLRDGLAALVERLATTDGLPRWIRLHYLYPGRISRRLVEALRGHPRVVPYVDLPLQHADPHVLRRMRRPGDPAAFLDQLAALDDALGGAGIRSAFIVGFPGETDRQFETLCRFVADGPFDAVGVFAYSHEDGTPAASLDDDVPPEVKDERRTQLEEIAAATSAERQRRRVGRMLDVLVEQVPGPDGPGTALGRWAGQAPEVDGHVLLEGFADARPGTLVRAGIVDGGPFELVGRPAGG